jgi:Phage integrase family
MTQSMASDSGLGCSGLGLSFASGFCGGAECLSGVFYGDQGERLYWFYRAWESACSRAGVPNLLFHDLRRSAVRNMERAGLSRKVAMSISGHKTGNVYRRYDIVAERDLADATAKLNDYFDAAKDRASAAGTLSDTPAHLDDTQPGERIRSYGA